MSPTSSAALGRRRRRIAVKAARYVLLTVGLLWILLPFVWLVSTAFKNQADAFALPPKIIFRPTLESFRQLFAGQFAHAIQNSFILTSVSTAIALLLGVPAGYGLAVGHSRMTRFAGYSLLAAYVMPGIVYVIPMFIIFLRLGLVNTYWGIVLAYETFLLPLTAWLMRSYFLDIPRDLEAAALIDGCTRFQAFRKIIVPTAVPGITTVGLLAAIAAWGEYFATLIIGGSDTYNANVAITGLMSGYSNSFGQLAAGALFITVPILLVTIVAQRGLLRGLTAGAVKG
jgi:multiple sugar transport system permease protein